jgi:hypothetical protein
VLPHSLTYKRKIRIFHKPPSLSIAGRKGGDHCSEMMRVRIDPIFARKQVNGDELGGESKTRYNRPHEYEGKTY